MKGYFYLHRKLIRNDEIGNSAFVPVCRTIELLTLPRHTIRNTRVIDLRTLNSDSDSRPLSDDSDSNHDSKSHDSNLNCIKAKI